MAVLRVRATVTDTLEAVAAVYTLLSRVAVTGHVENLKSRGSQLVPKGCTQLARFSPKCKRVCFKTDSSLVHSPLQ